MLTRIHNLLSGKQLRLVGQLLSEATFVDGKVSAGQSARQVKTNEELAPDSNVVAQLNEIVMGNLVRHPIYKNAALPLRVAVPFYARYTKGMAYGEHIDDPVMGMENRYRSDIAITVFLNDPTDYEGGELAVNTTFGEQTAKLPAGDAILYPASSRHRVTEVTSGERLVAITWVQSLVRDPAQRALLYELNQAREKMLRWAPDAEETHRVDHAYVNLVRMWAEV